VARTAGGGRVDVGVGIEPEQSQRTGGSRATGQRPDGKGVIAAENQRRAVLSQDRLDPTGQSTANFGDLRGVAGFLVAHRTVLRYADGDITVIANLVTQLAQAARQASSANGGRSHIYSPAALAKVQGNADDSYLPSR